MRKWCLCIACLGALLVACKKTPVEVPKHPYTQEELVKAHLDESFSAFITALDMDSTAVKRPERFVLENSSVSLDLLGENPAVVYRLKRHGESMLVVRYRTCACTTKAARWPSWRWTWDLPAWCSVSRTGRPMR